MSALDRVEAQASAVRTLKAALSADRLANAYLFHGPSGVGKLLTALSLAADGTGDPEARHRIEQGNHPDVRVFEPREDGKRNIRIDFMRREILPYAEYAPFETKRAFLIFPDADVSFPDTSAESANALLKTLEEPHPGVHFVLTATNPKRLLPTIRSRCQSVRFLRLPERLLTSIALDAGANDAIARRAALLCGGRADVCLALALDGRADELIELALYVDESAGSKSPGVLLDAAERLSKFDDLHLALDTLSYFYRDLTRVALGADSDSLLFSEIGDRLVRRATEVGAAEASARVAKIQGARQRFRENGNKQLVLESLVFRL